MSPLFAAEDQAPAKAAVTVEPTITGSLFWPNGDPVEKVRIEVIFTSSDCKTVASVWSDNNGKFHISGELAPQNTYQLKIHAFNIDGTSYHVCGVSVWLPSGTITSDLYLKKGIPDGCSKHPCL